MIAAARSPPSKLLLQGLPLCTVLFQQTGTDNLALRPGLAGTPEAVVSSTIQTVVLWCVSDTLASQVVLKNLAANEGDAKDECSILGPGRLPGIGNGSPLQYSCLENPMGRGIWWATVHRVAKSWT